MYPKDWKLSFKTEQELANHLGYSKAHLKRVVSDFPVLYKKVDTGKRTFWVPRGDLKNIQREIIKKIFCVSFDKCVHGGVRNRSIVTNALPHRSQRWVGCFDIKSFFPKTHYEKIFMFYLDIGLSVEPANLLLKLTTYDYQLPQGAPTSPVISNMILYPVDQRISTLCYRTGFRYTRFFDDITLSGRQNPKKFVQKISKILENNAYKLNLLKTKYQHSSSEQVVTGLTVNRKSLAVSSDTISKLTRKLHGYSKGTFDDEYNLAPHAVKDKISGQIVFIKSIDKNMGNSLYDIFRLIKWQHDD